MAGNMKFANPKTYFIYRIPSNKSPGGYFFREVFYPGAKSDRPVFEQRRLFF